MQTIGRILLTLLLVCAIGATILGILMAAPIVAIIIVIFMVGVAVFVGLEKDI